MGEHLLVRTFAPLLPCFLTPTGHIKQALDGGTFQGRWLSGTQTPLPRWHNHNIGCMSPSWVFSVLTGQSLDEAPSWGVLQTHTVGDAGGLGNDPVSPFLV